MIMLERRLEAMEQRLEVSTGLTGPWSIGWRQRWVRFGKKVSTEAIPILFYLEKISVN